MKDRYSIDIKSGDKVVFAIGPHLYFGLVVGFTPKNVKIQVDKRKVRGFQEYAPTIKDIFVRDPALIVVV